MNVTATQPDDQSDRNSQTHKRTNGDIFCARRQYFHPSTTIDFIETGDFFFLEPTPKMTGRPWWTAFSFFSFNSSLKIRTEIIIIERLEKSGCREFQAFWEETCSVNFYTATRPVLMTHFMNSIWRDWRLSEVCIHYLYIPMANVLPNFATVNKINLLKHHTVPETNNKIKMQISSRRSHS